MALPLRSTASLLCASCAKQHSIWGHSTRSFSSTTPQYKRWQSPKRKRLYKWLGKQGEILRVPREGDTNYLGAYLPDMRLRRQVQVQETLDKEEDSLREKLKEDPANEGLQNKLVDFKASKGLKRRNVPPATATEDMVPFPTNPDFVSEPVLGVIMKNQIYDDIKSGKTIRETSVKYGVDMSRVAAVYRLQEAEKEWREEGREPMYQYAEHVMSMLPRTEVNLDKIILDLERKLRRQARTRMEWKVRRQAAKSANSVYGENRSFQRWNDDICIAKGWKKQVWYAEFDKAYCEYVARRLEPRYQELLQEFKPHFKRKYGVDFPDSRNDYTTAATSELLVTEGMEEMSMTSREAPEAKALVHESINDLPVHPATGQQLFVPTSESRRFTREDAAKAFHPRFLSADKRVPHPELAQMYREKLEGLTDFEILENAKARKEAELRHEQDHYKMIREKEARTVRKVIKNNTVFRFQDIEVEAVGKDGRGINGVGWRYGVASMDRSKGNVKIPTFVDRPDHQRQVDYGH